MTTRHNTGSATRRRTRGFVCLALGFLLTLGCERSKTDSTGGDEGATSGSPTSTGNGSSGSGATASGSAGETTGAGGETDGSAACMTRFDAESCAELGDLCEFDPKPQLAYWDGGPECTTIERPGYGWCFPRINGGAQSPEVYWNPETGEITALSFMSLNIPPGWEVCVPGPDSPPCCCGPGTHFIELPYCGAGGSTGETAGSTGTGAGG